MPRDSTGSLKLAWQLASSVTLVSDEFVHMLEDEGCSTRASICLFRWSGGHYGDRAWPLRASARDSHLWGHRESTASPERLLSGEVSCSQTLSALLWVWYQPKCREPCNTNLFIIMCVCISLHLRVSSSFGGSVSPWEINKSRAAIFLSSTPVEHSLSVWTSRSHPS